MPLRDAPVKSGEDTKGDSLEAGWHISQCVLCQSPLPLRMPEDGQDSEVWACVRCGTSYDAVLREDASPELLRNVRPDGVLPSGPPDRCTYHTPTSRALDAAIEDGRSLRLALQGPPFANAIRPHEPTPPTQHVKQRFTEVTNRGADQLLEMSRLVEAGRAPALDTMEEISERALTQAAADIDVFAAVGMNPPKGDYPSRHALHVSMLSVAIGAAMQWDQPSLLQLGTGCLLHDLGMLCIERSSYEHKRRLSGNEYQEIAKHPVMVFELVSRSLDRVPVVSRMAAYQMHERCNGTGYPRGRSSRGIHEAAKIAAVADTFVALLSPRPHRPAIMPYHAMKDLLHQTNNGLYDPRVVRALLRTVSLFPLGSYVELDDGRQGQVVRATGDDYSRPVIEVWRSAGGPAEPSVVDLRRHKDVKVVRALPELV